MKKILLLFLLIGIFSASYSQKDPEADKILKKLSEETKSHEVIQANFTIEFKNIKENIQNTSDGSITMKGDKYRLKFMGTESFFDGKTLWTYISEVNEVNITEPEPDDDDIFSNPKKLFTIYENDYKYQLITKTSENSKNYSIIDLYPINLNEEFSRIRLQINTDKYTITSATIFGKDGSHYTISLFDYLLNKSVNDSNFIFDEKNYSDVEIIDMRF